MLGGIRDIINHRHLIHLIRTFYPQMSEEGICHGYTSMWLQASLHPEPEKALKSFYERFDLVSEYCLDSPDVDGIHEDRLKKDIDQTYLKDERPNK